MITDRITLDIDSYVPSMELKAIRAYQELSRMEIVEEVVVHTSTSGTGLHLQGRLSQRLDDETRYRIRNNLNDDTKRLALDEERGLVGHATDIFWSGKEGNDHERLEHPDIWAALDHIEHNRASDHSRVKALAQHGHKGVWDTHGLNRPSMAEGVR